MSMKLQTMGATVGAVWLAIGGPLAWAADASAPAGDACRRALDRVVQQEELQRVARSAGASKAGVGAGLEAARRQAARACLGGDSAPAQTAPRVQPPLSVAPIDVPAAAPRALAMRIPPPMIGSERPGSAPPARLTTVTRCDSAGCWTSDGNYLMRVGPNLAGPPGVCTVQAGILSCR